MDENKSAKSWLPDFLQGSKTKKQWPGGISPSETSSLLPHAREDLDEWASREDGEVYDLEDEGTTTSKLVYNEFTLLSRGSIPVIIAYTLQNSLQTISVVIVGRGSPEDLATAAFAYMFAMSTGWLIALGGSTAMDTLCSATFTGSKDPHDLGILLQRAFIVLGLFYIPVGILWIASEPVFLALGQDRQISRDSARFLSCLVPGGLGYIYFEIMKKYLQAQGEYLSFRFLYPCFFSTACRGHESRDICTADYIADQRWAKLSLYPYI